MPIQHHPSVRNLIIRRVFIAQIGLLLVFVLVVVVLYFNTTEAGSFIFSFLAGGIGGSVSLLRRLPNESDGSLSQIGASWVTTLTPLLYGSIMAAVAYLLFMSGILTGDNGGGLFTSNLFPNFTRPTLPDGTSLSVPVVLQIRPASVADGGKLLVWSFVAGYSERFVTGILSSLEQRGGGGDT